MTLSPSSVLVSGVNATDLRLLTGVAPIAEGEDSFNFEGVATVDSPLTGSEGLCLCELDFLGFFVGLSIAEDSAVNSLSAGSFLFLLLRVSCWPPWRSSGSSLAYLSFKPNFFHAGTCFGAGSVMGAIVEF